MSLTCQEERWNWVQKELDRKMDHCISVSPQPTASSHIQTHAHLLAKSQTSVVKLIIITRLLLE